MPSATSKHPIAVYFAVGANALIAVIKFVAAFFTGSSAMLSEGIHSVVDTGSQLLLLLGIHRSKKPADEMHSFGHGKELYFWSLIVAMLLFGIGGGMSVIRRDQSSPTSERNDGPHLNNPMWDGTASIVIGGILAAVAVFLAYECKGLLLGESADVEIVRRVHELAEADPAVERVQRPLTMHFGPDHVLLAMGVHFKSKLPAAELVAAVDRLKAVIEKDCPRIQRIFIEADSLKEHAVDIPQEALSRTEGIAAP